MTFATSWVLVSLGALFCSTSLSWQMQFQGTLYSFIRVPCDIVFLRQKFWVTQIMDERASSCSVLSFFWVIYFWWYTYYFNKRKICSQNWMHVTLRRGSFLWSGSASVYVRCWIKVNKLNIHSKKDTRGEETVVSTKTFVSFASDWTS
jgi:hypothetical protein